MRIVNMKLIYMFAILCSVSCAYSPVWAKNDNANSLRPGKYAIGIASDTRSHTWPRVLKALREHGYVEGRNLTIVPIKLGDVSDPVRQKELAEKINNEVDLFFVAGNLLPKLFRLNDLKTPVCYIATRETANIPSGIQDYFTGVIRGSYSTILLMARSLHKGSRKMGFIYRKESNIAQRTLKVMQKTAKTNNVTMNVKEVSQTEDIGPAMKALRETSDFVLLFPPAVNRTDVVEIIKWQNELKLPVVSQLGKRIKSGLLGGPVVDWQVVIPKLTEIVDRLLQGTPPADVPTYYHTGKFVINQSVAETLAITIPKRIMEQAEIVR